MVPETKSESTSKPPPAENKPCPEERHLSTEWMVLVGSLILAWASLAPVVWIGGLLLGKGLVSRAVILSAVGLLAFVLNLRCLRTHLFELYQKAEKAAGGAPTRFQIGLLLGMQTLAALVCTGLSGKLNPIGMQQWFWMPVAGFGGLLLMRRSHMVALLLLTLFVSTLHQWIAHGPPTAVYWMFGQITTSVFIMSCSFAMAQASRQRLKTAQMAAELCAAHTKLELQADQASVLAVAQERNRMAREIHDAVGHSLTVVGAQLEAAQALLQKSPVQALDSIQKAQRANREGLAEIRRSVSTMRVTSSEQRTLTESLTSLITAAERPGLKLSLEQTGRSRPLPSLVEISLFRCAQECITNACRHSGAAEIRVHLDFTCDDRVSLSVADNGRGFGDRVERGHGLNGLRERATLLHGVFTIGDGPQGGGLCRLEVPA